MRILFLPMPYEPRTDLAGARKHATERNDLCPVPGLPDPERLWLGHPARKARRFPLRQPQRPHQRHLVAV